MTTANGSPCSNLPSFSAFIGSLIMSEIFFHVIMGDLSRFLLDTIFPRSSKAAYLLYSKKRGFVNWKDSIFDLLFLNDFRLKLELHVVPNV